MSGRVLAGPLITLRAKRLTRETEIDYGNNKEDSDQVSE